MFLHQGNILKNCQKKINDDKTPEELKSQRKPTTAWANQELLNVIEKRTGIKDTDSELSKKLVVFMRSTEIKIDPKDTGIGLNIGIVAHKTTAIFDSEHATEGYEFYEFVANFHKDIKKTNRKYATLQKEGCDHPKNGFRGRFFAKPEDAILLKKSYRNELGYSWPKKN